MNVGLAMLLLMALSRYSFAQTIHIGDFKPDVNGMPGEQRYEKSIEVGTEADITAVVDVTARGNGILAFANLKLKVLDEHDDGLIYVGGLLYVEFVDVSEDGFKDVVITGTIANTGEKETDRVTYSTVTSIYVYQPQRREFRSVFHIGPTLD